MSYSMRMGAYTRRTWPLGIAEFVRSDYDCPRPIIGTVPFLPTTATQRTSCTDSGVCLPVYVSGTGGKP
jgi:hypothetical protein